MNAENQTPLGGWTGLLLDSDGFPVPGEQVERDPENELQTLLDLLSLPWDVRPSIGQLATAIETHGIAGYDEYGRECKAGKDNRTSALALEALRKYYAAGIAYEMDGGEDPKLARKLIHPDYFWMDDGRSPLVEYGWLKTAVPDFGEKPPEKPRKPRTPRPRDRTLLTVIAALCKDNPRIGDVRKGDRAPRGASKHIQILVDELPGVLDKNTLTEILESCRGL
jgi:hypothetical protein